jgi:hypothetical protein
VCVYIGVGVFVRVSDVEKAVAVRRCGGAEVTPRARGADRNKDLSGVLHIYLLHDFCYRADKPETAKPSQAFWGALSRVICR